MLGWLTFFRVLSEDYNRTTASAQAWFDTRGLISRWALVAVPGRLVRSGRCWTLRLAPRPMLI